MDSTELNADQTGEMCERLRQAMAYVYKMRTRMERLNYPPDDRLFRDTIKAQMPW